MATALASVNHRVYVKGVLHLELLGVEWYDNAPAYRGCVRALQQLFTLVATTPLQIVSAGIVYDLPDQASFRQWVAQVFEGNQPWGFHERLQ